MYLVVDINAIEVELFHPRGKSICNSNRVRAGGRGRISRAKS
jgi:hypothetical protein